jgi:flagellar hook-length control protein FliK
VPVSVANLAQQSPNALSGDASAPKSAKQQIPPKLTGNDHFQTPGQPGQNQTKDATILDSSSDSDLNSATATIAQSILPQAPLAEEKGETRTEDAVPWASTNLPVVQQASEDGAAPAAAQNPVIPGMATTPVASALFPAVPSLPRSEAAGTTTNNGSTAGSIRVKLADKHFVTEPMPSDHRINASDIAPAQDASASTATNSVAQAREAQFSAAALKQATSASKKDASRIEPTAKSKDQNTDTTNSSDAASLDSQPAKPQPSSPSQVLAISEKTTGQAPSMPASTKAAAPKSGTTDPSMSPALSDGVDDTAPSPLPLLVNTARLMQEANRSDFRIGMQTPELGNINIHTSMIAHTFSAQIFVERGEAAHALAGELPGLYARLADQKVLSGPIQIHADAMATSSGMAHDPQQQQSQPSQQKAPTGFAGDFLPGPKAISSLEILSAGDRLDIRI